MTLSERPPPARRWRPALGALGLGALAAAAAFTCALFAFGRADRAAPSDVIVVLGARAYADGQPSEALRERVETAAALFHRGLGRKLMLSGGVDASGVSEPRVMAEVAARAGVPRAAMVLDETGVNTAATVRAVAREARREGWRSALFVSHDYHLARVAWLARREGVEATTSPADEGDTPLRGKPLYVLREFASWAVMLSGTRGWFELRAVGPELALGPQPRVEGVDAKAARLRQRVRALGDAAPPQPGVERGAFLDGGGRRGRSGGVDGRRGRFDDVGGCRGCFDGADDRRGSVDGLGGRGSEGRRRRRLRLGRGRARGLRGRRDRGAELGGRRDRGGALGGRGAELGGRGAALGGRGAELGGRGAALGAGRPGGRDGRPEHVDRDEGRERGLVAAAARGGVAGDRLPRRRVGRLGAPRARRAIVGGVGLGPTAGRLLARLTRCHSLASVRVTRRAPRPPRATRASEGAPRRRARGPSPGRPGVVPPVTRS
ncbi:MAG TPA: YdcF family protein [Polyangiaceae bacterium]|nr:YdcF family protein [Polyangiaceae bacterium]